MKILKSKYPVAPFQDSRRATFQYLKSLFSLNCTNQNGRVAILSILFVDTHNQEEY